MAGKEVTNLLLARTLTVASTSAGRYLCLSHGSKQLVRVCMPQVSARAW